MVSGKPAGRCFLKRVNHSFTPVNHSARMEGRMFRLTLMAVLFASQAFAGAWPREKGSVFAMTSYQVSAPDLSGPVSSYYSGYFEYGLGSRLTLGADTGHSVSGESKVVLFLRRPLAQTDGGHVFAAEIGLGKIGSDTVVRPGLSYGYGFSGARGSGWFSVDLLFEHHLGMDRTDAKADITYGRNHARGFKTIWQLQTGKQRGDPSFARLAPSIALPIGARSHLELGVSTALRGPDEYGLKLGLWHEF